MIHQIFGAGVGERGGGGGWGGRAVELRREKMKLCSPFIFS